MKPQELHQQLIQEVTTQPLSQLLPKVHHLAIAIGDKELEKWSGLEIDGYYNTNYHLDESTEVPSYRQIVGQYFDVLGRPIVFEDPKLAFLSEYRLRQGVPELDSLVEDKNIKVIKDASRHKILKDTFGVEVSRFEFTHHQIVSVLAGIRSELSRRLRNIDLSLPTDTLDYVDSDYNFNRLHPTIAQASSGLFENGHYRQAVLDGYIALVEEVKQKSGKDDLEGVGLMSTVFSEKKSILKISNDSDEQKGYMWMFMGAVMGIRNRHAHSLIPMTDPQTAYEWLSFASVLTRRLDAAEENVDIIEEA